MAKKTIDTGSFPSGLSEKQFKDRFNQEANRLNIVFNEDILNNHWVTYNTKLNTVTSVIDRFNPSKIAGNFSADILQTQEQKGFMPGLSEEMIKSSTAVKEIFNFVSSIKSPLDVLTGGVRLLAVQTELYLTQQTELLGIINKQAGLTGKFSEDLRDELTNANIPLSRLGIGFEELAIAQKNLIESTGRFLGLNRESWDDAGKAASAYVGTLSNLVSMYPNFERVGVGASNVAKEVVIAGNRTISLGLQSQKVISELNNNLGKINEYGFKNGIQGLTEMTRKSLVFRMNMDSVFKIAEDVFDPDKAINLSANLQAIGGAIGDFNDPLRLMYMATNDVEGLQDALVGVAGSLATYNDEQGRFEITGVNLRRARALASELGISYNELANGAIAAAERSSAATAMMASGLDLDEDTKRFLTNISTMKDGQMTIQLQGDEMRRVLGTNEIVLERLTTTQLEQLKQYQNEFKSLTSEQIIEKQATTVENINRNVSYLAAAARVSAARVGSKFVDSIKNMVGYDPGDALKWVKQTADSLVSTMVSTDKTNQSNKPQTINTPVSSGNLVKLRPLEVESGSLQSKDTTQSSNNIKKDVNLNQTIAITSNGPNSDDITRELIKHREEFMNPLNYTSIII